MMIELFVSNVVFNREFVLLHDAYQFKNPDCIYQQYDPFNLDHRDSPESKAEFRVETKSASLWGDLDQDHSDQSAKEPMIPCPFNGSFGEP